MAIDFRNTNTVWASVLVETLARLGLQTAIVCPGSRSAPLAVAFASHPTVEAIPVLDERSAAFFALGLARQTNRPIALICTSGTAGANFYPAIIEARESRVPLLILTADRPPELRHCNAGQTVDQQKLFGHYPNWYAELALPALELPLLAYLRQTVIQSWQAAQFPVPGPVHLNLPFRDPLAPVTQQAAQEFASQFNESQFFDFLDAPSPYGRSIEQLNISAPEAFLSQCYAPASDRGLIIVGSGQPADPVAYCQAIAHLSQVLGWPVLAEGLSPLRNHASLNPYLVSTYDLILRQRELADSLAPDRVIRIGEMPTSKELRSWLERCQPRQWVLDAGGRNLDPLHGQTVHLPIAIETLAPALPAGTPPEKSPYLQQWCLAEARTRLAVDQAMAELDWLCEAKVAWLLAQSLPEATPLLIASSMPVRDVEFFWPPNDRGIQPYFNRGANGIDGTLSTALGVAHRNRSAVMLTGDLALLHDTNGFLVGRQFQGHLTIVLINNNGGGIFEMLPIAPFDPPFEQFFATPQGIDFAQLCATYGVTYERIAHWEQLHQCLSDLPDRGIRLLEIPTNRKADAQWRQNNLGQFAVRSGINPYAS